MLVNGENAVQAAAVAGGDQPKASEAQHCVERSGGVLELHLRPEVPDSRVRGALLV